LISSLLVKPITCKSGAQTLDGSKYSNSEMDKLLIHTMTRSSQLMEPRMRKDKELSSMATKRELTKSGRLSMLIKPSQIEPRDSTRNSASTSTDHSMLDQECLCKESLSAMVLTMFG